MIKKNLNILMRPLKSLEVPWRLEIRLPSLFLRLWPCGMAFSSAVPKQSVREYSITQYLNTIHLPFLLLIRLIVGRFHMHSLTLFCFVLWTGLSRHFVTQNYTGTVYLCGFNDPIYNKSVWDCDVGQKVTYPN